MVGLSGLVTISCQKAAHQAPPPQTYPVTGKVSFKDGRPFSGGVIQFLSKSDPTLTMTGKIEKDGTFTVYTLFQEEKLPGAVPGPCVVMISPPIKENKPVDLYQPAQTFLVQATSNHFVIEIDPPKRSQ
jgi:hypothetical protein